MTRNRKTNLKKRFIYFIGITLSPNLKKRKFKTLEEMNAFKFNGS